MSRADRIKAEIKKLQGQLKGLAPMDTMGVRELARASGVSPMTVTRFKRGDMTDLTTAKKLMPYLNDCPCCGQKLPKIKDQQNAE